MRFEYFTPTRIVFGRGALANLGKLTAPLGRRVLVVTGRKAMRQSGILDRATKLLAAEDLDVSIFDQISANPRSEQVDAGAALVRERGIQAVIGLGGGSAIDACKAIALASSYEKVADVIGKTLKPNPSSLPIVAVPTTAGTGSEVTKGAIILDSDRQFKSGIRGDDLFPRIAVVDPSLTDGLPREISLETGFDALTHAVESVLTRSSTPLTLALAAAAIPKLCRALLQIVEGSVTVETRDELAFAALLGGLNVATAGSCLPHRLQQAMGSLTRLETSHAQGLALVYPAWLKKVRQLAPDACSRLDTLFHSEDAVQVILDLIEKIGLAKRLRDVGYREDDIEFFLANVSGNVENDPIPSINVSVMKEILEEVF